MPADLTLVNLNMLYVRYADGRTEREKHLPLGPLYLATGYADTGDFAVYFYLGNPFRVSRFD